MKYALLALLLAACNPYLYQASAPPPGRTARLDPVNGFWTVKRYRLAVSEGVALAITCEHAGPCEKLKIVSDNPAIAEVRLASLSALERIGLGMQQQPTAAFVVIGKAPGRTRLHVTTSDGGRTVEVTVESPPGHADLVTAAAEHATGS